MFKAKITVTAILGIVLGADPSIFTAITQRWEGVAAWHRECALGQV